MTMKVAPPYSLLCLDLSGAQWTVAPFVCKAVIGACPSNQCLLGRAQARPSPSPTRCPHNTPGPPRPALAPAGSAWKLPRAATRRRWQWLRTPHRRSTTGVWCCRRATWGRGTIMCLFRLPVLLVGRRHHSRGFAWSQLKLQSRVQKAWRVL
jgi:hypothetical protein